MYGKDGLSGFEKTKIYVKSPNDTVKLDIQL